MKRRELLKSLAALSISPLAVTANNGDDRFVNTAIVNEGVHYVVFYDPDVLDPLSITSTNNYLANASLFPVHRKQGESLDDEIRIYEIKEEDCPDAT